MYPFLRLVTTLRSGRAAPPLAPTATHVSRHICWPWDIDPFLELNNGRALTLYDLGRVGLGARQGLFAVLRHEGWGLAVAGASVRFRRRLRAFDRFEMRSRGLGWDARFLYIEQSMWRRGECTSHILLRMAFTGSTGIVPMARVAAAWGLEGESPPLPEWVTAWIAAEAERPWPPMADAAPGSG